LRVSRRARDRRQQALEAGPRDAAARAAEIVIDDLDGDPSELLGAMGAL
jgi:hypothetical protein